MGVGLLEAHRETGLAEFCRAQHGPVVGLLSLYLGDRDLAEELAQDALVRVVDRWDEVSTMARPDAWVRRVALNLANSAIRRRVAGRRARERHGNRADVREWRHEPDTAEAITVRRAVASLPPRQRTALVLRYYADLPVAEVAATMGCSEPNVKALTAAAIDRLRSMGLEVTE